MKFAKLSNKYRTVISNAALWGEKSLSTLITEISPRAKHPSDFARRNEQHPLVSFRLERSGRSTKGIPLGKSHYEIKHEISHPDKSGIRNDIFVHLHLSYGYRP